MTINESWEYTFDKLIVAELTFVPDQNFTLNSIPTFSGQETFKIIIE